MPKGWPSSGPGTLGATGQTGNRTLAFRRGVRFGGQQLGVDVHGFAARCPAADRVGSRRGRVLAEHQVVRFPLDCLTGPESEGLHAWAPPAAGRLAAGLAGLDVVAGRVPGRALVDLLPDVIEVVALAQGRDNGQAGLAVRGPEAA